MEQGFHLRREREGGYTITHITEAPGTVQNEYSYDAWGRRRNFTNWTYTVAAQTDLLPGRGFTGHEWLPWFNMYNMYGRLYDPLVGRFLSPDNNVQMPDYTQNFNRYSYALNNPLKYTDPDGENPLLAFIIGAIAGAYLGGTATNDWNWNPGKWDYQNPATYFGIVGGGLAGGLGAQWMFGPGGVMAGGAPLNVSLGASFGNAGTAFANFSIGGGSGFTLQTLGYATVAGGGLYATGSTIKNFLKEHVVIDSEIRLDRGIKHLLKVKF